MVCLDPCMLHMSGDAFGLCASSGTLSGITTDCVKGSNSELQKMKQHKTQSTLISTLS